jgi:hypothetical protein
MFISNKISKLILITSLVIVHATSTATGFSSSIQSSLARGKSTLNMVAEGDSLPDVTLKELAEQGGKPVEVKLTDLTKYVVFRAAFL